MSDDKDNGIPQELTEYQMFVALLAAIVRHEEGGIEQHILEMKGYEYRVSIALSIIEEVKRKTS